MPPDLAAWLAALSDGQDEDSEAYPQDVSKRLFYVLGVSPRAGAPQLQVQLALADMRRDGTIGAISGSPNPSQLIHAEPPPRYLRPVRQGDPAPHVG